MIVERVVRWDSAVIIEANDNTRQCTVVRLWSMTADIRDACRTRGWSILEVLHHATAAVVTDDDEHLCSLARNWLLEADDATIVVATQRCIRRQCRDKWCRIDWLERLKLDDVHVEHKLLVSSIVDPAVNTVAERNNACQLS